MMTILLSSKKRKAKDLQADALEKKLRQATNSCQNNPLPRDRESESESTRWPRRRIRGGNDDRPKRLLGEKLERVFNCLRCIGDIYP